MMRGHSSGVGIPGSLQQITQGHRHWVPGLGLMPVLVLHMLCKRVVVWRRPKAHGAVQFACSRMNVVKTVLLQDRLRAVLQQACLAFPITFAPTIRRVGA